MLADVVAPNIRVCFVAHGATMEGACRYLLDQADYLLRKQFGVFAIVPTDGPLRAALMSRGVPVEIVPSRWWTRNYFPTSPPDFGAAVKTARRIAAIVHEWSVDVVYTHTVVAPAGPLGAALAGVPHIWHLHEFAYNPTGIRMAIAQPEFARLLDVTSNRVYFNSVAVAAEWANMLPAEKTRLVYNWTSPVVDDALPDTEDEVALKLLRDESVFVVAIVGSVHRWKRQSDAIAAVANLLSEGRNVALLIVGPSAEPAYVAELTETVALRELTQRVRFLGYTEFPQRVMRAANVTLVCSDKEPFGRVTIESMAQGTPVIGADSGGTSEIIEHDVDGMLFPTGDVPALTERLRTLIADRDLQRRLAAALQRSRKFQDADVAMQPVLDDLAALAGKQNPTWPFGSVINDGLATLFSAEISTQPSASIIRKALRKLVRREK